MINSNPKRNVLAITIGILTVGITYFYTKYESPEDCFVREMNEWAQNEGLTDKITGMNSERDRKLVVAKAKTIMKEYNVLRTKGDGEKIYLEIVTLLEYCNVK